MLCADGPDRLFRQTQINEIFVDIRFRFAVWVSIRTRIRYLTNSKFTLPFAFEKCEYFSASSDSHSHHKNTTANEDKYYQRLTSASWDFAMSTSVLAAG